MKTRCKFTCNSVTEDRNGFSYSFSPVAGSSEENERFFHYTPYGKLEFGCTEERQFEPGKEYYLDITLAEGS